MKRMTKFGAMAVMLFGVLSIITGGAWAATSTVAGSVIFDKTAITAGSDVNLAILGLNSQGIVDTTGTNIFAEITSLQGTVNPTGTSIANPGTGSFKAGSKEYVKLTSGIGQAYISYPSNAGNDLVTVILQEKMSDSTYRTIASYSQSISVTPQTATTGAIAIYSMFGGATNFDAAVNPANNKVGVVAYTKGTTTTDTAASGTVTVTLRPKGTSDNYGNVPTQTYTFTGTMASGVAQVAVDGTSITQAGDYYVEATFGEFSSVGMDPAQAKTVTVNPSNPVKYQVVPFNSTIGTVPGAEAYGTGNGTTVRVTMLDSYGNITTGSSGTFTLKANDYVKFQTAYSKGTSVTGQFVSTSFIDISASATAKGTASIYAYDGGLIASDPTSIVVVDKRFETVNVLANNLTATYSTTFLNGLVEKNSTGTAKSFGEGNSVTLTFLDKSKAKLKTVDYQATVQTASGDNLVVVTPVKSISANHVKISGSGYGDYTLQTPVVINGGPANQLFVMNAHGQSVTAIPVVFMSGTSYSTSVYYRGIRILDAQGNVATDGGTTPYSVTVSTSNGSPASQPFTTGNVDVTYDAAIYSGTDTSFKVALTNNANVNAKPTVIIPSLGLNKINAYLSSTTIPAGGIAPIRVETLNASNSKVTSTVVVDWVSTASEANVYDAANTTAIGKGSVQTITNGSKTFTFRAGTKTGDVTLTFRNSAGDIKAEVKITVTSNQTPATTVGAGSGKQTAEVTSSQMLNLVVNTTNSHNDTPVFTWFMFTGTAKGVALPTYLLTSNNGIVQLTSATDIYKNTYVYPSASPAFIAQLSMADLGLKSGDTFAYAYAYQNQVGQIVIDNIVTITVK